MRPSILPRLTERLEGLGLSRDHHIFLLQDMAIYADHQPPLTHRQINQRLKYLGWRELELDYRTFELMSLYLDSDEDLCPGSCTAPLPCSPHPFKSRYRMQKEN